MTRADARLLAETRALNGDRFTASHLTGVLFAANGHRDTFSDGGECFRVADAVIQKLRRKGLIGFKRENGRTIWSMVVA